MWVCGGRKSGHMPVWQRMLMGIRSTLAVQPWPFNPGRSVRPRQRTLATPPCHTEQGRVPPVHARNRNASVPGGFSQSSCNTLLRCARHDGVVILNHCITPPRHVAACLGIQWLSISTPTGLCWRCNGCCATARATAQSSITGSTARSTERIAARIAARSTARSTARIAARIAALVPAMLAPTARSNAEAALATRPAAAPPALHALHGTRAGHGVCAVMLQEMLKDGRSSAWLQVQQQYRTD